jgi:glycosyltransferase involved in cell wall biosynthesis
MPEKVRVGFVTESFLDDQGRLFEGGAERHLLRLVEMVRRLGAEVIVYQRADTPGRSEYAGIRVVRCSVRLARLGAVLGRLALEDGCTHVHFQYLNRVPRGLPLDRVTATWHGLYWDIPYVATYHSWYPGGRLAKLALPMWRRLQKFRCLAAVARCRAVLSTDTSLLRVVQSDRPELRERVMVVPNFSDLEPGSVPNTVDHDADGVLVPLESAREEGSVVVLVPRNLSFVRGGAWLAEIVALTVEQYSANCDFFLTSASVSVYGSAGRHRRLLDRSLSRLDAATRQRLHILGGLPHTVMPDALELSDVVLVPTFAFESTSLAALEAMRFGRPVVCTNVGGLNDAVRDGFTGLVVPPAADAIAAAVARLAGDAILRRRLGEEAQREAVACSTLAAWEERATRFAASVGWTSETDRG